MQTSGRPRKLTPCQEGFVMREVGKIWHASSAQFVESLESQTGVFSVAP